MQPDRPTLPDALRADLARAGLEFLAEFYEAALRHRPDNLEALAELAHAYTRLGWVDRGLAIDRRLVELEPENPTVHYNLACSLALAGESEKALDALEHAALLGYTDADFLSQDDDLMSVRADARFTRLVERLRQKA
ncbi:MAG: tetratricopeptide repeat protein [Planctomycetes bacterium]|nr:tetratricopeptide repeat protein [Planctomycetota bacterium]